MRSSRIFRKDKSLSLPVKRKTKIRYKTGVKIPPIYSNFDQNIFSTMVGAAVSNTRKKDPTPAASISMASSLAPFTKRRFQARKATKKEISAVARKKTENIVKINFIEWLINELFDPNCQIQYQT